MSRLLLEVESVRVERLQAISQEDAIAEGIRWDGRFWQGARHPVKGTPKVFATPRAAFASLWDGINEKRGHGWESNPWVWVVSFRRITR